MKNILAVNNLEIHQYIMPGLESNMYLLMEGKEALIIDPVADPDAIALMKECGIRKIIVLLTHEHFDHISGVNLLREHFDVEVTASEAAEKFLGDPNKNMAKFWDILMMDKPPEKREEGKAIADDNYSCYADVSFVERMEFTWNDHKLHIETAPGHSKGSVLIFLDDILFSGDSLVNGAGVICRLPGGSWKDYCAKTRPVIEVLPDDTWVFPGHGEPARLCEVRKYLNKFGSVC